MPSDVPNERLHDIITNIDRARAHLKGMTPGSELDDSSPSFGSRPRVEW